LGEIREGVLTEESIGILKSRIDAELKLPPNIKATFLMPLKTLVKKENEKALKELKGDPIKFTWTRTDHNISPALADKLFGKIVKNIPAEEIVELKVGCPVMLLVNLCVEEGFVNGMQGFIDFFDEEDGFPHVTFSNGKKLKILQYTWVKKSDKSSMQNFSGIIVKQIPLTVAAALTIHKVFF